MSKSTQRRSNGAGRAAVLAMTLGLLLWRVGSAQAAPQVEISVDDAQVNEGNSVTFRVEMTDPPATPNIIPVSVQIWSSGAGTNPVPVEISDMGHHRLWFTEGVERHSLTVRTTQQAGTNTATTISAQVQSSHHFTITGNATVTAQAVNHAAPTLNVAADSEAVTIKEGTAAQIVIELDDAAKSDIDVNLKTEVTTGVDNHYPEIQEGQLGMRTVRIHRGNRRAFVPLFARDDNVVNHGKAVTLTLLTGTGYTLGSDSTAVITIQADTVTNQSHTPPEGADTAILRWERCAEDVLANEDDGTVSVTAVVEGTIQSTWSFKAIEAGGWNSTFHAALSTDIASNTVTADREVASGQTRIRVPVDIINDGGIESEESFGFELAVNGPARQSIHVDEACKLKVLRISDDDTANITAGPRVRRVTEGEKISFNVKVDDQRSGNCPIPFDIQVRGQVSGDAGALGSIVSSHRSEQNVDVDSCVASATLEFDTTALTGVQVARRIGIDLWTTSESDAVTGAVERTREHDKITIEGEPSTLARYTVYIDDTDDTTPVVTPATNVRIQGGNAYSEGRLEVFTNNQWGTVCDDYWSKRSADVACRSLGFADGSRGRAWDYTKAFFGAGGANVPIHFDDVRCSGDETSLFNCPRRASGHNCRHREDVGVSCAGTALPGPATPAIPTVVTQAGSNALQLNEGDTATFWVDRHQAYDTALDVKTLVIVNEDGEGDPLTTKFNIASDELGERTVTIPAGQARASITVTMNDDDIYDATTYIDLTIQSDEERDDQTNQVTKAASYTIGARSTSTAGFRNGTYKINAAGERYFDDREDRPAIGWEGCDAPFVVNEDVGHAVLTVETKGISTVAFNYAIVLVNMEGTASRHNDYVDADATGTHDVPAGQREITFEIGIVDSDQIEDTEQFEISLFRNALDAAVEFVYECRIKTIVINDDDTATMTMGDRVRTVTEGNDIDLEIVVEEEDGDNCIIPYPVNVQLTPAGDDVAVLQDAQGVASSNSYVEKLDGEVVQSAFPPCTKRRSVTWGTIVTAGDQGTRTVYLDVTWPARNNEGRNVVLFDGGLEQPVRYTIHIEDSEATIDNNTNQPRNVDPPDGKGPKGPPAPTPITATLQGLPAEHDGSSPFTFELHLTPTPAHVSYQTVQGALFTVGNGQITKAARLVKRQHGGWAVTVEPDGPDDISIELNPTPDCTASGAVCTPEGGALMTGLTRTVQGPPVMSIADASVDEAEGVTLDFEVSLSRAASGTTSVDYATSDGTASAGIDYDATSGTLSFAAGETRKTIAVTVHDDAHNEGAETLTLSLSNPSGVKLGDATATGTINNTDPMPTAWMIRVGRTIGSQVVEGLTDRLEGGDESRMIVGGIGLGSSGELEDILKPRDPFAITAWDDQEGEDNTQTMSASEVLRSTAFHMSNASSETADGPTLSVWGRFAHGGFEAKEDKVTTDGEVTTGIMGLDARWGGTLAGLMLTQTSSDGTYRLQGDDRGTVESDLTGIYPYARLDLTAKVSAWVLAGVGAGELTLRSEQAGDMPTDISMRLGAIGVKGRLLDGSGPSGIGLNIKSDAMWVEMKNDDTPELLGASASATRLRVSLQGERVFGSEYGSEFVPNAEIGIRHDSGDAETGTGIELGAGMRYRAGLFSIEAQARALIVHEAPGYGDWGLSAAMRLNPSASGRGMTLSIAPQWGRTATGTHHLWSTRSELGNHDAFEPDARIAMDAGYGFGAGPGRGVLTPYAGLTLGREPDYTIRAGARWQLAPDVVFGVEHTQSDETSEVWARAALRF